MGILKRIRKKKEKKLSDKEKFLSGEYEKGRVLQIDNEKDNKEHFESRK